MMRFDHDDGPEAMEFETDTVSREVRHTPNPQPWRWVTKQDLLTTPQPKGKPNPCNS